MLQTSRPSDYDDLIASAQWQDTLNDLNQYLAASLTRADEAPVLNGNLFYDHLARDFQTLPLTPQFDAKRRNFFQLAQHSTCMFEIGVNGGHSMLLALMANPALQCVGVDVCERLNPRWARVDIYVPAAFAWLRYKFPDRVRLVKGNSLIETPRFTVENPDAKVDFLHLDGAKNTHVQEVLAIRDLMPSGAFIVHDDFNMRPVRLADRQLRRIGMTKPVDYEANNLTDCPHHIIRANG